MPIQIVPSYVDNNILTPQEQNLVASREMTRFFGIPGDFVQLFIYTNLNTLISNNPNYQEYSVTENKEINFDPAYDIERAGIRLGTYNMVYNFLRPLLTQNPDLDLFIYQISPDRKEIRIRTTTDNNLFYTNAIAYIDLIQNREYFIEYYLDFGNNNLTTALSLAVEQDVFGTATVIAKLEDPLPQNIGVNSPLNVVEKIVNTYQYQAILTSDVVLTSSAPSLRQANFGIEVDSYRIGSSDYYSYSQILNTFPYSSPSVSVTYYTPNGSSGLPLGYYTPDLNDLINSYYIYTTAGGGEPNFNELQTLLAFISSSNPTVNVDYADYNSFIHFGSALQQLQTFQYKLGLIQSYQNAIDDLPSTDLNSILYKNKIGELFQSFTGYENYLYYQSGSYAWPKSNSTLPYINYPTTSSQAITWYNIQSTSASYFDEFNNNNLIYALPQYLQESPTFSNVAPFVYSMGQLFDDIWVYIKAMTDLWRADNALQTGISKDMVGIALQSLGVKLYTDGDQDNIYEWLYGTTPQGSPYFQTASWQTGITASQYTMAGQDEAKSIFKRIYANLPTLLKSKGTDKFINYLNTLYGTPDTILFPMQFGGLDKSNTTAEYVYNKFTYAIQSSPEQFYWVDKNSVSPDSYQANTFELRFKPEYTSSIQTVLTATNHSTPSVPFWGVTIEPVIVDGYQYGIARLHVKRTATPTYQTIDTSPLPLFVTGSDGETNWWNLRVQQTLTGYTLTVQNEVQGEVGHKSYSVMTPTLPLVDLDGTPDRSYELGNVARVLFSTNINDPVFWPGKYYGQIQEFRAWTELLNDYSFDAHTLDPESYVGNSVSSSYDNLLFRFPLGNNLLLPTTPTTGSQPNSSYNRILNFNGVLPSSYVSFTETYYTTPAVGGYSIPNTVKIRIVDETLATTRLQQYKSVVYPKVLPTTTDIQLTQTGFSPQDQINNDIIEQLGDTYNLDELIGNPRFSDLNYYPGLEQLQEEYFQKYIASYNYKDFIQLMETFHKSLFRYLADYIPGRANNATGIVIKPHILERSKTRRYEPTIDTASYSGETWTVTITGSNPGNYCCSRNSPLNEAFFDGEFEGSVIPMDSYYTQNNPFTRAICDCRLYQVTTDGLVLYTDCNGTPKFNSDPGQRTFQVYACKDKIDDLFSTNFTLQDLGQFAEGQAFVEQYEGWDALDNNVENNNVSQFKKKKQPSLQDLFGPCYRTLITNQGGFATTADYQYLDCNNIRQTGTLGAFGFVYVNAILNSVSASGSTPSSYILPFLDSNINTQVTSSYEWQDSYLTDAGYVFSRESGVQTTAKDFNETFLADFSFNVGGNTFLGSNSLPNAEQNQDFIAFADWSQNTLAERYGSTLYHIRYLIDSTGSVYKPEYTSSYWYNTDQNFGSETPVNVAIYNGSSSINQDFNTTVYQPLKKFETIIYSDTGSWGTPYLQPGFIPTMSFFSPQGFLTNVEAYINNVPNLSSGGGLPGGKRFYHPINFEAVKFLTPIIDYAGGWNAGNFSYVAPGNFGSLVQITGSVVVYNNNNANKVDNITCSLVKNGVVLSKAFLDNLGSNDYGKLTVTASTTYNVGDQYYVTYNCDDNPSAAQDVYITNVNGGDVTNFILTSGLTTSAPVVTSSYFTSSFESTVLTASTALSYFYGGGFTQIPVTSNGTGSGFSNPISFTIKPYDQIRFGGNENRVYTIMSSSLSSTGQLFLYLDRTPQGVNLNYFAIRRLVNDPGFIILNNNPMIEQSGEAPAFIIPKYITPQLKENLPNIIAELSAKGLI